MGLGRWDRATRIWDRGLHGLKAVGGVSDYARALLCVGRFYLERGETEPGLKILREAQGLSRELGNLSLVAKIDELVSHAGSSHIPTHTRAF